MSDIILNIQQTVQCAEADDEWEPMRVAVKSEDGSHDVGPSTNGKIHNAPITCWDSVWHAEIISQVTRISSKQWGEILAAIDAARKESKA